MAVAEPAGCPGGVLDTPTDDQRAVPATISWNPRMRPSAAGFQ